MSPVSGLVVRRLLSHTITQGLSWLTFPDQYLAYLTRPWKQIQGGLAIVACRSLIRVLSTDIESSRWYTTLIGAFIRASPTFLVSVFQVAVPCHLSLLNTDKVITATTEHCRTGGVKIHVKKNLLDNLTKLISAGTGNIFAGFAIVWDFIGGIWEMSSVGLKQAEVRSH